MSVDTEEDNWDNIYEDPTTKNINELPKLQKVLETYDVVPTYLISYPVATDLESINTLKTIFEKGKCEIGSHLHPWNTPPFEERLTPQNTMLNNIPYELQFKKLQNLHEAIIHNYNFEPKSFRAGRYGLDTNLVKNLIRLGYKVDSSITPFLDWSSLYGPDFSNHYNLFPYYIGLFRFSVSS